jgi:hypothetical protein
MTELNPAAKQICEDNYKSNCPRCPLRPACIQSVNSRESYNRWQAEVTELVEQLISEGQS